MQKLQFLSDSWIEQVQRLKVAASDNPVSVPGFVVNATITGIPFGEGTLLVHSASGPMVGWVKGHAAGAAVEFETDYHFAKALILDDSPDFSLLTTAIDSGAMKITGDGDALHRWFTTRVANPEVVALEDAVREITT